VPEKETINLKNQLRELVQQGKWKQIVSMEQEIMTSLANEPGAVDAKLIRVFLCQIVVT
jgi:hypothetical protein